MATMLHVHEERTVYDVVKTPEMMLLSEKGSHGVSAGVTYAAAEQTDRQTDRQSKTHTQTHTHRQTDTHRHTHLSGKVSHGRMSHCYCVS